jgi:hypothetical protein
MAGEAEVDEPLAVEPAGHFLQDFDAPLAVLDQVVVGGEDAGDAALDREWGNEKVESQKFVQAQIVLSRSVRNALHSELKDLKVILDETDICLGRVCNKANDAIGEASFHCQDRAFGNIRGDCDA